MISLQIAFKGWAFNRSMAALLLLFPLLLLGCRVVGSGDEEIDWQSVEAAPLEDGIFQAGLICRKLDGWHNGKESSLVMTFKESRVIDGHGNELEMTPEQWKGLISYVNWHLQRTSGEDYLRASSPPSNLFREDTDWGKDEFGSITRYSYHIRIINEENLDIRTIGPWQ